MAATGRVVWQITIDVDVRDRFKALCFQQHVEPSTVVNSLMKYFVEDKLVIEGIENENENEQG